MYPYASASGDTAVLYTSLAIHDDFQIGHWTSLHCIAKVNNPSKYFHDLGCFDL
jgi:hypothetical protein